mmetsp:Transcript_13007/g.16122  ORF Transcript_13007/g.16122 Transcript_13007/m.16122 type:complete len:104 (-) Transcript_13007:16-327(-)
MFLSVLFCPQKLIQIFWLFSLDVPHHLLFPFPPIFAFCCLACFVISFQSQKSVQKGNFTKKNHKKVSETSFIIVAILDVGISILVDIIITGIIVAVGVIIGCG